MRARRSHVDSLAGIGLGRPAPESDGMLMTVDCHLHSEGDAICPRCLSWIEEREFVRQTGFGVFQHEVCPPR